MIKKFFTLSLFIILFFTVPTSRAYGFCICSDSLSTRWIEDLEYVVEILKTRHPNVFYHLSQEEFFDGVSRLKEEIPYLSDEEIVVRLMQLVSKVQDGHTWIYPYEVENFDTWFPVRFAPFPDGLFLSIVDVKYTDILGCKVKRIGKFTAKEAFDIVGTVAFADNPFGRAYSTPVMLSNAQVLKTLGIIPSTGNLPIELESQNGEKMRFNIEGVKTQFDAFWLTRPDSGPPGGEYVSIFTEKKDLLPQHLKNRLKYYWYEYIEEDQTIYLQVNAIAHSPEETFEHFTERFWEYVEEREDDLDKLIVDLRYNTGGNGYLLMPFIHEFIKHGRVNQRGKLFVIVGKGTVSAGMTALALMVEHTHMISVGEPPATSMNFFSDSNIFQLPNSQMYMWVPSLYRQGGHPADKSYYSPDIPFLLKGKDYFSGQDPVIEAIVNNRIIRPADILWEKGGKAFQEEYERITGKSSPLSWWKPNSRSVFEDVARRLFEVKKYDDALIALEVNARTFPQFWETWIGLATVYAEKGNYAKALDACNKALEISPANGFIWQRIEQIKEKK